MVGSGTPAWTAATPKLRPRRIGRARSPRRRAATAVATGGDDGARHYGDVDLVQGLAATLERDAIEHFPLGTVAAEDDGTRFAGSDRGRRDACGDAASLHEFPLSVVRSDAAPVRASDPYLVAALLERESNPGHDVQLEQPAAPCGGDQRRGTPDDVPRTPQRGLVLEGLFSAPDAIDQLEREPVHAQFGEHLDEGEEAGISRARGDEIVGHGRTNSEHQNDFDEAGEAALIREATETIARHEGRPPTGWLGPGVNPSDVTPDLLQEAGYTCILDWPMDDQPVWIKTRRGWLLSLPYPHEVNDIPMIMLHHGDAGAFADMIIDNFDEMLDQSRKQPLVCCVSLHAFVVGQPYRLRHLRRALSHICKHRDTLWITTGGEIASYFAESAPVEPE